MVVETSDSILEETPSSSALLKSGFEALHGHGQLGDARKLFEAAAVCAESEDDSDAIGLAAIGLSGLWVGQTRSAVWQARSKAWRRLALDRATPHSSVALRLMIRTIAEEDYSQGRADNALAMVKRAAESKDAVAHAEALSVAHQCMLGPGFHSKRLAVAEDLLAVAAFTGRPIDTHMGLLWRTVDLFLAGNSHADRSMAELRSRVEAYGHAALSFVVSAMQVMCEIRLANFERAEELAYRCATAAAEVGDDDGAAWLGAHIGAIRWYQGRSDELIGMYESLMPSPTLVDANEAFVAGLAVAAAAAGDRNRALAALNRLRGSGFSRLMSSSTWMVQIFAATHAARMLHDQDVAADAYSLLKPYAELPIMASLAIACFGSAHYPLGVAAGVAGDHNRAVDHLTRAVRINDMMANIPAGILARLELASALGRRGDPDDARAAKLQRSIAESAAQQRGMQRWLSASASPADDQGIRCYRLGTDWHLSAFGIAIELKHSVGMNYLAVLFANPDQELPAVDLIGAETPAHIAGDAPQPILDQAARKALRDRLTALREAEDDALKQGNQQRADQLRSEYDWIVNDLRRARGLSGRDRAFTDDAERARIAVQKAIRRALNSITTCDPALGQRLSRNVRTGRYCCYRTS